MKRLIKKRYREHKWNAECRGIEFCLTFEEWIAIWLESGHLDERGCRSGCYVMARHDDKGPYKVGNVEIITVEKNLSDAVVRHRGPMSSEHRRKISLAMMGHRHSEETKRSMSEVRMGYRHSEETKRKISTSCIEKLNLRKGRPVKTVSEETRRKMSAARMGKKHSEETKRKISAAAMGRTFSLETRRKLSAATKGISRGPMSEETKRKISVAHKARKGN